MTSAEIRQTFLDYFRKQGHKIVPSAPIVLKNDPTLMFNNSGMVQFKDYFLGNKIATDKRVADTQKCLRASGKHNDLEDVGVDSYHHTMFEMLGNWSFGDYFKKEAIDWAWDLLTNVYELDKDRLYVSVFEGDASVGLERDNEAAGYWEQYLSKDRILDFDAKDNFWEMGETGPCGPCSEIHVDLRSDADRQKIAGRDLVNADHPQVIEIWNLVFIQYNRKADRSLEPLPNKHVDTGMGFERLCMALQGKMSNYATDVFTPLIKAIEAASGKKYGFSYATDAKSDIAMRVVADHLRATAFTIADGQLPSNNGAGYVVRRILRRGVRYYYSFLDIKEPLLHKLLPLLAEQFKDVFPELAAQKDFVQKVILEEEKSFLRTLESGLKRFETLKAKNGIVDGRTAFELYDTFGFPLDLTQLLAAEKGWTVDVEAFNVALGEQQARGKADAVKQVGDWMSLSDELDVNFVGYDELKAEAKVLKYRTVKVKDKNEYQVVLNNTPFYAEGGGQVGDTGFLFFGEEQIGVIDTQRENDLIIHFIKKLPTDISATVRAEVNARKRSMTENNHSATHLLHAALRQVLGEHVAQKGSLVNDKYLRFDFSHFEKVTPEQLSVIEQITNKRIRENIALGEDRSIPIAEAKAAGAMMLFGEKYGENVRMITFDADYSRELCGGCHVPFTGKIGALKITTETSVAAGVRRIEAVTADAAESYVNKEISELNDIRGLFKNPKNMAKTVSDLQEENKSLKKQVEKLGALQARIAKADLLANAEEINGVQFIGGKVEIDSADAIKQLAFDLGRDSKNLFFVAGANLGGKPNLTLYISKELVESRDLDASKIIRDIAKEIKGGGGGQPFFATAGGKDLSGLDRAIELAKGLV
mgnify:CR=1 FL=1